MERIKSEILNTIKRGPSRGLFKHKIRIEEKIYLEVPIFANLLETYFYDEEKFHGYLNSHYSTWINIFQDDFIRMIITYNNAYNFYIIKKVEKEAKMLKMADDYNADKLIKDLEDMGLSSNINSLITTMNKSRITRKKPSMIAKKRGI